MGEQPAKVVGPGPLVTTALIISTSVAALSIITATGLVVRHPDGHGTLTYALTMFGVSALSTVLLACHRESRRRTVKGQQAIIAAIREARAEAADEHRQMTAATQGLGVRLDALEKTHEGYNSDEYSHAYADSRQDLAAELTARIDQLAATVAGLAGGGGGGVTPFPGLPGPRRSGR